MTDQLAKLDVFIRKSGSSLAPEQFYHHVQTAFHDVESEQYDALHGEMYAYLGGIFDRLFIAAAGTGRQLALLDIGAGTGLVETFLAGKYAGQIGRIDVVEPNARMIARLEEKNKAWKLPLTCVNAYLDAAALRGPYDVVICSSVLHHVPDLGRFFGVLHGLVRPGGHVLTMQDPRREALDDAVAAERRGELSASQDITQPSGGISGAVKRAIWKTLSATGVDVRRLRRNPFEKQVNRLLLERGVIRRRLALDEIWAITDIHVPGQPGGIGSGISRDQLREWLPGFQESQYLTYNFFNANLLELPDAFKAREREYSECGDPHGYLFASLFGKGG